MIFWYSQLLRRSLATRRAAGWCTTRRAAGWCTTRPQTEMEKWFRLLTEAEARASAPSFGAGRGGGQAANPPAPGHAVPQQAPPAQHTAAAAHAAAAAQGPQQPHTQAPNQPQPRPEPAAAAVRKKKKAKKSADGNGSQDAGGALGAGSGQRLPCAVAGAPAVAVSPAPGGAGAEGTGKAFEHQQKRGRVVAGLSLSYSLPRAARAALRAFARRTNCPLFDTRCISFS